MIAERFFAQLPPAALSHGYVFTGPAGAGKKRFARFLAQSLLCTAPKSTILGCCDACSACVQIASGSHPDLYVAEGQVKIGERDGSGFHGEETTARDLVRQLTLHSYAGGKRVFLLGDVEFTREAANALLKFFEEPPAGVVLLLTTTSADRLLPTVRSRLVEVPFAAPGGAPARSDDEESMRESAAAWFFAVVAGEDADASGWATRATLADGLDVVKTLARDWLARIVGGADAPMLAPDQSAQIEALPAAEPASIARALGALTDAERIAQTNVSAGLVADLAKMALASIARVTTSAR